LSLWQRLGLGRSQQQAAESAAPPAAIPTELGVTGTPIIGGFLRDAGEYNSALDGLSAFQTYEKMRRSDAQVAATLLAMKLPIRAADWTVTPPQNATSTEAEAAQLLRECFFECIDFGAVVENALLMLDFGVAAHEDVYEIDGNRVRLKKLAPRLPLTFYRWITSGENLTAIEQMGWRGDQYVTVQVPAEKLAIFTWQQEGANFAGRSVLRPMYQHWYIKSAFYKIDAIAVERNGMGIPWIEMGPDAKQEDRKTAFEWLEKLSVHEKAAILLPPGWKFGLRGVEGATRNAHEAIAHHNMQISMAGLAQFMMMGTTASGDGALGETHTEFFFQALDAMAKRIARVLTLTTARRLVEFNFGAGVRTPVLKPQQVQSTDFNSVVAALKELANASVGLIQPDDDLEQWIRDKIGMPPARPAGRTRVVTNAN
jgi:phage gp29-like protein